MKSLTIALATAKEAIRQPAFFVMACFAGALLVVTIFVPYFTFGEDMKMYKDTGLTTISFFSMLLALLTASSTVADEIEGKTAITLLSKPINRRQFIVGKFLGIELGVLRFTSCWVPCSPEEYGTNMRMIYANPRGGSPKRPSSGNK